MKKSSGFFKKFRHLYLISGFWLGFSLIGLSVFFPSLNSVVTLKVGGQPYPWKSVKSLAISNSSMLKSLKKGDQTKIRVIYENGCEIEHPLIIKKVAESSSKNRSISADVILEPKTIITTQGPYRYNKIRIMNATAYYPGPECTGKYSVYGLTYTGKKAGYGLVAVDPRVIPLGTKLYIEGYGHAEAADIGGAIKGNRIDLCFQTYQEAKRFGRKKIKVYILE